LIPGVHGGDLRFSNVLFTIYVLFYNWTARHLRSSDACVEQRSKNLTIYNSVLIPVTTR
jgi:hypothetical protein